MPLQLVSPEPRNMVRVTALLPRADNEGRLFPPEYFLAVQQFLVRAGKGVQEHGVVFGRWVSDAGKGCTDLCTPFVVTCPSEVASRLQHDLEVLIKTLFEQEAAYVELCEVRVSGF